MTPLTPIPDDLMPAAIALWRLHFGPRGAGEASPGHGLVVLDDAGGLAGVMGLRDANGGFWRPHRPGLLAWLYRAGPDSRDLVIDGVAAARPGQGAGRALVTAALSTARLRGYPGLRAEVRQDNRTAVAFYRALGFVETGRGRLGLPWDGMVLILRLPAHANITVHQPDKVTGISMTDVGTIAPDGSVAASSLAEATCDAAQ
ncbi:MAG: GNAT family N-acetyltransferase [Paracoccus sp. (in: a-proteobacteria)]|nr:GNAT family N-acetyltransferase [Paracoccus sp. (in: a-proteobacteria)]